MSIWEDIAEAWRQSSPAENFTKGVVGGVTSVSNLILTTDTVTNATDYCANEIKETVKNNKKLTAAITSGVAAFGTIAGAKSKKGQELIKTANNTVGILAGDKTATLPEEKEKKDGPVVGYLKDQGIGVGVGIVMKLTKDGLVEGLLD